MTNDTKVKIFKALAKKLANRGHKPSFAKFIKYLIKDQSIQKSLDSDPIEKSFMYGFEYGMREFFDALGNVEDFTKVCDNYPLVVEDKINELEKAIKEFKKLKK